MLGRHSAPITAVRWLINFRGQRRAIGRRWIFTVLPRITPAIAVDADGLRIYVSTTDRGVSSAIFAHGFYERELFMQVNAVLVRYDQCPLSGRGFLDIGANIGTATCLALKAHGASQAWAFEPAPRNVHLLRQNVVANRFSDRVTVEPCALSDRDGKADFELSDTNWGDHRVRLDGVVAPREANDESRRAVASVPTRRFDGFVASGALDLGSIGLAWIDVQGHESHVLRGATTLLSSAIPIVCEYWPYGLERAGGDKAFAEVVAAHRSWFVDLNDASAVVRSTADLAALFGKYRDAATNILILA